MEQRAGYHRTTGTPGRYGPRPGRGAANGFATTGPARPKLRPIRWAVSGPELGFYRTGWMVFWLLQGERDRGVDELEGLSLGAGRLGEHRDGGGGAGEADLVAGQGG